LKINKTLCSQYSYSLFHYSTSGESQAPDKRVAARQLIKRYYFQLTEGCGDPNCNNEHCASSKKVQPLSPNQAAAQVLASKIIDKIHLLILVNYS
jgi:hypothetical protein